MARSSQDDWPPGGHGGREALEELARRQHEAAGWSARKLHNHWRAVMADLVRGRIYKSTVSPQEFNSFRRRRLDEGITDAQLAQSFEIYATAVMYGPISVRHNDLWRHYAAHWARWTQPVSAGVREPLKGRRRRSDWQR